MAAGAARGGRLAILAVLAILSHTAHGQTAELKDHVVTLNDTATSADEEARDVETNEVYLWNEDAEPTYHPHEMLGKPTKFDMDADQLTITDDRQSYQIESSMIDNSQVNTIDASDCRKGTIMACIRQDLGEFLDRLATYEVFNITESVQIVRAENTTEDMEGRAYEDEEQSGLMDKVERYARNHVLKIQVDKDLVPRKARTFFGAVFQGKSTFLTGFGLGFLAFGLKKLLLPLFIGAQIIKTALIALFLPSIIGSLGKIVGKGLATFAQSSQSAAPQQPEENFEFKDNNDFYSEDYLTRQPVGTLPASAMYDESMLQNAMTQKSPEIASRYSFVDPKITHAGALSDRYYTRHVASHGLSKTQDFKVFHEIPTSSLLLTNYDPFYSPLLSRLDAVFSRLGHTSEGCREYTVCAMYRNPARYAPYSNLVSAQLSRELNELRKPSSDNPDVLRFFRYMKAAKDGQDGMRCEDVYANCATAREDQTLRQNQAMLATYQDIDKLVHARKM